MTREVVGLVCTLGLAVVGTHSHLRAASDTPLEIRLVSSDPLLTNPEAITTDGANLYIANDRSIVSLPLAGGAATMPYVDLAVDRVTGLTRRGADLFWIGRDADGNATAIFKAPTTGGPVTTVYSGLTADQIIVHGVDVASYGSKLYATDAIDGRIFSLNADGSDVTLLGTNFGGSADGTHRLSIAADDVGMLYMADSGFPGGPAAESVFSVPAIGSGAMTLHNGTPLLAAADVAVGDGSVYVADQQANTVWQIPAAGGTPIQVVAGAPFTRIGGLVYWDHALYVTDTGNAPTVDGPGAVYRIALPRTPIVKLPTTTALASRSNASTFGQAVTFAAVVSNSLQPVRGGTVEFFDGSMSLGTAVLSSGSASLLTSSVRAGSRSITAVYSGDDENQRSTSSATTQTVNRSSTTTSVTVSPTAQEYSDRETFEATVTPQFSGSGEAPAESVTFKIGSQTMGTAPLVASGKSFKARLADVPLLEPTSPSGQLIAGTRIVTAVFNEVNSNFSVSNAYKPITITREGASATYTGTKSAKTSSTDRRKATVKLSATVKDISATADANGDSDAGDIRKAIVSFVDRATGVTIAVVPVTLGANGDSTSGTASYDWMVDIGTASSRTFKIGVVVSQYYTRNSGSDDVYVTVSK